MVCVLIVEGMSVEVNVMLSLILLCHLYYVLILCIYICNYSHCIGLQLKRGLYNQFGFLKSHSTDLCIYALKP